MHGTFPWKEAATVVEFRPDGERTDRVVAFEVPLTSAADFLLNLTPPERKRLSVSLPHRRVAPTGYGGAELEDLVAARRWMLARGPDAG
jgi:hypothetical protein